VITAASVARANAALEAHRFNFALLDVNLGAETSLAIADRLKARNIPFLFATGYGDSTLALDKYPGTPLINKPYGVPHVLQALAKLGFK